MTRDSVSMTFPIKRVADALRALQSMKVRPIKQWVCWDTGSPLTARQRRMAKKYVAGLEEASWDWWPTVRRAALKLTFDKPDQAVLFKLALVTE